MTEGDHSQDPVRDTEDLDAQGPSADLVRVYLNGIGKTALLSAEQEVELAKRIEAGVFAAHKLETAKRLSLAEARPTCAPSSGTETGPATTCWSPTCGWWCRWPSATPAAECHCST